MKLYKDQECKDPFPRLDFGEVTLGQSQTVTAFLKNETGGSLRKIVVKCSDPDIQVECVESLVPDGVAPVKFVWKPALNLRRGLRAEIELNAEAVYGG